jgi:tetratricopeptide (TPR) repeat protein
MLAFLLYQVPAPAPQAQAASSAMPPELDAFLKAKDWNGLSDWFETVSPTIRGRHVEYWIQGLNRAGRWERLLAVCEALQPQLEAKSGPRLATYRLYRAQALSQLGRHGEAALVHLENGRLGYSNGFPNACVEARQAGDWETLLTAAQELLARRPEDAAGLGWKGEGLARVNRFAEAEAVLRAALAKDATDAYAWNNLGRCLNERKAWQEACEALNRALTLEPGQLEARFNRGRCLFELKRYKESRDDFKAALALSPGDPVLQENLRQAERYAAVAPRRP